MKNSTEFVGLRLGDRLSRLAASVPVYRLECRPDLSAVETLEDLIL